MSRNLRSILGFSNRVQKSPAKPRAASSKSPRASPSKRRAGRGARGGGAGDRPEEGRNEEAEEEEGDEADEFYFQDRLDDVGLVRILATDLHLRDVVQAMRYIRDRMWTAVPERASGMNSTRIADVLNYRKRTPPVVTLAHLQAVLASPTAVEREVAELLSKGIVRRILVRGRSEALIEVQDLISLVEEVEGPGEETKKAYAAFVRGETNPEAVLGMEQVDELVRAGFLTSLAARMHGAVTGSPAGSAASTRGLLGSSMSLEHVAKAPTGSLGAVGGRAINMVTGKGTPTSSPVPRSQRLHPASAENIAVSAPGHGGFLKLHKAALEHLLALLDKRSAYREMPESLLREAWDGGLAAAGGGGAKRARGEHSGVAPGKTKKWRDFWGLRFEWVLEEAVGAGVVELFDTGSVGRGVRAV